MISKSIGQSVGLLESTRSHQRQCLLAAYAQDPYRLMAEAYYAGPLGAPTAWALMAHAGEDLPAQSGWDQLLHW